jgi:hypothetical protein
MSRAELGEAPLYQPAQDRLEMVPHACKLSEILESTELPFTVGIYGPWGAGKTTFANLLVFHLRERSGWGDARYLEFSAWPYVTADAIWRALLEQIARLIFNCPAEAPSKGPEGWRRRLGASLLAEAVDLSSVHQESAEEKCERLVSRFDRAAPLASRTPSTMQALAGLMLDAAATAAPAVGPLRRLLAPNGEGAASGEGAGAHVARSVEDIRKDLGEVFDHDPGAPIIVLLDDLDRCLPEVALDVLETIKIFFFESAGKQAPCLFLVAADERLIGRGLRARLGDTAGDADGVDARAYLEKIVQLGVGLPDVYPRQAHDLVAAWRPEWATSADLIVAPLDTNPRRVKQQCTLLSYRFWARPTDPPLDPACRMVLDKLTTLHAMCPEIMPILSRTSDLAAHEALGKNGAVEPRTKLARLLRRRADVCEEFTRSEVLTNVDAPTLAVLVALADARPGPAGVPASADRVFAYIVERVADQSGTTSVDRLDQLFLQAVLQLADEMPELVDALKRTDRRRYAHVVAELDNWLEGELGGEPAEGPPSDAAAVLIEICRPRVGMEVENPLLMRSPRISQIPREHVEFVTTEHVDELHRDRDKTKPTGLAATIWAGLKTVGKVAQAFELNQRRVMSVERRLEVARDLVERRKFAKVQLLQARWPALSGHVRSATGLVRLRDLETSVRQPGAEVTLSPSHQALAGDERLQEFLRIPPFFNDIYAREMASLAARPGEDSVEALVLPPGPPDEAPVHAYADLALTVQHGPLGDGDRMNATVTVVAPDGSQALDVVALPLGKIDELVGRLAPLYLSGATVPVARGVGLPAAIVPAGELLRDLGSTLWSTTIGASRSLRTAIETVFREHDRVRLALETDSPRLAAVPWECLRIPIRDTFAGQSLKLSVVRAVRDPVALAPSRASRPLRILIAVANPEEAPLPGAEQEIAIVQRAVEDSADPGAIRLEIVRDTTDTKLRSKLQTFAPHVLHFVGHGYVRDGTGYVALIGDEGEIQGFPADEVGTMLRDHDILLAVLNGCTTGSSEAEDLAGGVAQFLVAHGVPAAIATTRVILDDVALKFAEEFYGALTAGYPAEAALVEARKALSLRGWDWSAYVMYAAPEFPLQDLRAPRATQRSSAPA